MEHKSNSSFHNPPDPVKLLPGFLYYRRRVIAVIAIVMCVFAIFMFIYGLPAEAVIYSVAICAAVVGGVAVFDFVRYVNKYRELKLLEKTVLLSLDGLPEGDSEVEDEYRELIKILFTSRAEVKSEADKRYNDAERYFTMWVHQIKTPIAGMDLVLQNGDFEEAAELAGGLLRIEEYAEMALLYVQLGNGSEDFVFRRQGLEEIVLREARRLSGQFIRKGVKLIVGDVEVEVLTDARWLGFVIGQVLSNSLKYTREGCVQVELETAGEAVLVIRDTGIGIAEEDLPRVFERGFSGMNGRLGGRSTGLGLNLCKSVCEKLGVKIEVRSSCQPGGTFTEVRLDLREHKIDIRE